MTASVAIGPAEPDPSYREILPRARLARHVACFWVQTVGARPHVHRVVPDGCADIVSIAGAAPFVVGPATGPVLVTLPAGALIVGARFRPGMAPAALGAPASALLDAEAPLADLWGRADGDRLWNELGDGGSTAAKLGALEGAVGARLDRGDPIRPRADPLVAAAVAWLGRHPDRHVGELQASIGLGSRQLLRRFRDSVGYGPKLLHRVLRFQRLLVAAERPGRGARLVALAAEAGYLDQAHMTRDVAELAGVPPRVLLAHRYAPAAMADFFATVDGDDRWSPP